MKTILAIEKCGLYCGGAVNLKGWVEYYTKNNKANVDVLVGEKGDLINELLKTQANVINIPLPMSLKKYGKKVIKLENIVNTFFSLLSYNIKLIKTLNVSNYDKIVFNSYRTSVFYFIFLVFVRVFTSSQIILRLQISETPIRPLFKVICLLSHSIIVHGTKGYCEREFGASFVNKLKTTCLPNPVDVDKFKFDSKARTELRSELGINSQTTVLLSVCFIEPRKGVLELVESFNKSASENMVLVHVGGHGQHDGYYEKVVSNANEKVIFLGQRSDIERIYSIADVFVLYSKYEGMPYVIVEAMASGLPIISTYAGSNSDIITSEVGFLVNFGDTEALKKLIFEFSKENFSELGVSSRKNAVMFYSDKFYYKKLTEIL